MPRRLLQWFGIDLDGALNSVEYRAGVWKQRALSEVKAEAADIGTRVGLFAAAGLLGMAALLGLAVAAIYLLVPLTGQVGAWAIAGVSLALIASVLAAIALRDKSVEPQPIIASPPPPRRPAETGPASASAPSFAGSNPARDVLRKPLALILASALNWPPATGTRLDEPLMNLGRRAGQNSDGVIEEAEDIMRHGTRATIFGILGAAAAVGFLMARNRPSQRT